MALAKQGKSSSSMSDKPTIRKGMKPQETKDAGNNGAVVAKQPGGSGQNPKRPR